MPEPQENWSAARAEAAELRRQLDAKYPNRQAEQRESIERLRAAFEAEGGSLDDEVDWLLEQLPKWRHRDCQL